MKEPNPGGLPPRRFVPDRISGGLWRGAAAAADDKERAVPDSNYRRGGTGVAEDSGTGGRMDMRSRTNRTEGAGRAVLRGFEVADQVVVLERRGGNQQGVQHHTEQGETPQPTIQPRNHPSR